MSEPLPPHFAHWPPGIPHEADVPRLTLPQVLAASAARRPAHPAIVYAGRAFSYAALVARADALAAYLRQRLGVAPGDRVLVVSQNCPQFVVAAYAVLRAGAVVVPVSPMCRTGEIAFHAQDSGARVALVAQEIVPQLPLGDAPGAVAAAVVHAYIDAVAPSMATDTTLPDDVRRARQPLHDPRLHDHEAAIQEAQSRGFAPGPLPTDPDALAVVPYTSGTTGQPKGCRHTHATLLASLAASAVWKRLDAQSVVLTVAPLFHMLGLQNGMNLPLYLGATAVMMPRWHAAAAAALMEKHRVTAWSAPPAMVIDLFNAHGTAQRDLSSLKLLSGGGAAMPAAVAAMLLDRYGLVYEEAYGLTETASFLHANPPQRCKRQCLGIPTQGVASLIVDPLSLAPLPPGEVGELVTHAPQVMLGYWQRPEADRQSFVTIGGKRYLRTGDLAHVDADGYFFLRDRLKRMINVSGYKVWPAEVESAMYAHPAVLEACVVGVPDTRPGHLGSDLVKAIVVLKPAARGTLDAAALIAWCRTTMAVYKAPRAIEFVDQLPKSATGKILWRDLQAKHATMAAAETASPKSEDAG